jgi:hypothetical protein
MTKNSSTEDNHNLVMFPSSKNFKAHSNNVLGGQDPLYDLLHEFSDINDEQIPKYLDDRFENAGGKNFLSTFEEELDGDSYHSLEAFMNRHQRNEVMTPDDVLIKFINERIEAIKAGKERIKFYLDEIDMFLPSRKK